VGDEEKFCFPFQTAEEASAEGEVVEAVGIAGSGRGGGGVRGSGGAVESAIGGGRNG